MAPRENKSVWKHSFLVPGQGILSSAQDGPGPGGEQGRDILRQGGGSQKAVQAPWLLLLQVALTICIVFTELGTCGFNNEDNWWKEEGLLNQQTASVQLCKFWAV